MKFAALLPAGTSVLVGLVLQGCGGGGGTETTTTLTTSTQTTTTVTTTTTKPKGSYDGSPEFQLSDKGMHAISYNPLYLPDPSCIKNYGQGFCAGPFPNDDVSAEWAMNMWSSEGRGDIKIMKSLGANSVRLYGNRADMSKRKFLDELLRNRMKAVAGISTYPFNAQPGGCAFNDYNCYEAIKINYKLALTKGEFAKDGFYHNAIDVVSLVNEPDVWINLAIVPGWDGTGNNMIRGLVQAFDAVLSAEKEENVQPWNDGSLPKLTIAWSYAMMNSYGIPCSEVGYVVNKTECGPSIGFMAMFYHAVHDPERTVKYKPQNNLTAAFEERWVNSFQPFQDSDSVYRLAIEPAKSLDSLKNQKMYLGEYDPSVNMCRDEPSCAAYDPDKLEADMKSILTDSKWTDMVYGMSYFQFQTAYNKDGRHEFAYGLFNLVETSCWNTTYIDGDTAPNHPINCLEWKSAAVKKKAQAVANAFGGSLPTLNCPCDGATDLVV